MADPVVDKGFLPGAVDFHQLTTQLGGQPGAQGLIEGVLLVAEAAADVGLDNPDLPPGEAQGLAADPADDVGDLGGGGDNDPPPLHVGGTDMVLNVAVLDGRGIIPALYLDEARLLAGGLVAAVPDLGVAQHVAGIVFVELGRIGSHGLLHVQHKGEFLIVYLHQPGGLGSGHLIPGHHNGDIVAVKAHMAGQQQPVGHILMVGVRGPGVPGGREIVLRHVETGENLDHAGDTFRLRRVNRFHQAMGHGGMDQAGGQGIPAAQVIGVFRTARRLIKGVYAGLALAYAFAHWASASCLSGGWGW